MKRIVINDCYGGFSLSHRATMEYARRHGVTLYVFKNRPGDFDGKVPLSPDDNADRMFMVMYYTTPTAEDDSYYSKRDMPRDDAVLLALMDEWGSARVSGAMAELAVVEVPDDVEWEIDEYDGMEHVAEKHRTWYAE